MSIRIDLIEETLKKEMEQGRKYDPFKISKREIEKLKKEYHCVEHAELFYDSEPEYDNETYRMYMDYTDYIKKLAKSKNKMSGDMIDHGNLDGKTYSVKPHTIGELKKAYQTILNQRKEYEETRLRFNNWVEPYFKGNWELTQKAVDAIGYMELKYLIKHSGSLKNRFWKATTDDGRLWIYFYGRDLNKRDYSWIYESKKKG